MLERRPHGAHLFLLLIALTLAIPAVANAQSKECPKVTKIKATTPDNKFIYLNSANIRLGDKVTVKIEAGGSQKNCALGPDSAEDTWLPGISNENAIALVPFLNGRAFKGIHPEAIDPQEHTVTFHLMRTQASADAWSDLLSRPGYAPRVVTLSVGLENGAQIDTELMLDIIIFKKEGVIAGVVVFLILLWLLYRLAKWTTLLRDPGTSTETPTIRDIFIPPFGRPKENIQLGPYSLARFQMAFWFVLVIIAFVLIWIVIGDTDTITQGVLVLIGISAGTAVGATAIDSSKRPTTPEPQLGEKSEGWFTDILSDEKGISFHRLQIFVWTIVLGFVFCRHVFNALAMEDFSTNLLTLMGISSGTYIGMKPFEQGAPEAPPATPPPGNNPETQPEEPKPEGGS